ncbi:hypothetical protein ACWCPS_17615 [Streptomyces mauvecolor]
MATNNPRTNPRPAIGPAGFIDDYLYSCEPVPNCGVCTALASELKQAREAPGHGKAYDAAAEIRNHPHPHRPQSEH